MDEGLDEKRLIKEGNWGEEMAHGKGSGMDRERIV